MHTKNAHLLFANSDKNKGNSSPYGYSVSFLVFIKNLVWSFMLLFPLYTWYQVPLHITSWKHVWVKLCNYISDMHSLWEKPSYSEYSVMHSSKECLILSSKLNDDYSTKNFHDFHFLSWGKLKKFSIDIKFTQIW